MQNIPPRLWYRYPCVIRNSNWRIFVGLALTVLFLNRHLSKPRSCRKPMPMLESEKAPLPVGEGLG